MLAMHLCIINLFFYAAQCYQQRWAFLS